MEGLAHFHQGMFSDVIASLQAAVEHCRQAQISAADTLAFLAETFATLGACDLTREVVSQSLAELEAFAAAFRPLTLETLARAYMTLGLLTEAETVLARAVTSGPESGGMSWTRSPHVLAKAAQALGEALALACGARRLLWQIYADLAETEGAQAHVSAAVRLWRLAREEVDLLAGHAGTEDRREAFVARPEMRRVLAQSGRLERIAS